MEYKPKREVEINVWKWQYIPGEAGQVRVKADHERWRSNHMQTEKTQTKNMLHIHKHKHISLWN